MAFFTKENWAHGPFESFVLPMTKEEALQKMAHFEAQGWRGPIAESMRESMHEELRERGYE